MRDVKQELQNVFRDVFDDDDIVIHDAMTAAELEDWDSFGHINLLIASEKHFGVKFSTGEINNLKNVGEFIALITSKLS